MCNRFGFDHIEHSNNNVNSFTLEQSHCGTQTLFLENALSSSLQRIVNSVSIIKWVIWGSYKGLF